MLEFLTVGLVSFLISFLIGPKTIPIFSRLKFGQTVRDDGPETHLQKNGTPTMGGFIFIIAITMASIFAVLFYKNIEIKQMAFALLSMILFGIVGFTDDYIKVVRKRSLGLNAKQKILMQVVFSMVIALLAQNLSKLGSSIYIPYVNALLDLGVLYIPFAMFVIIALVNSVNLTDGLDGLASSVTIVVSLGFALIAYKMGYGTIVIFLFAVIGSLIGFLRVNSFPAEIFMGDTGSMALGGAVAAVAVIMGVELLVPLLCFVYFMESLSVIIQVSYFKKTGKRFFRMAPIHHHFEKLGWHETKVLKLFILITIIMGLLSTWGIWSA